MKEAIVNVLQQRMDKCTTEQFWAVATLTGLNAFVISQKEDIVAVLPSWAILIAVTVATFYGVYYIIHRHTSYYFLRDELARLLQTDQDVPVFLKRCPNKWKGSSLLGVLFYEGWLLGMWVVSLIIYL